MSQIESIKCGMCHYEFDYGVSVCQGCQGSVVYGATWAEQAEGRKIGATIWGAGSLFVLYALPMLLNSQYGWNISSGWGIGIWGLLIAAAAGAWGAVNGAEKARESRRGEVRTFRRM